MTRKEKELYESAESEYPGVNLYWLPGVWFSHNMREAQKHGKIAFNDGARLIMSVSILKKSTEFFCFIISLSVFIFKNNIIGILRNSF